MSIQGVGSSAAASVLPLAVATNGSAASVTTTQPIAANASVSTPSTIVSLSQAAPSAALTYGSSSPKLAGPTNSVWEGDSTDSISALMSKNFASDSAAGAFAGLGAAMLGRFQTDTSNYSQSVMVPSAADQAANVQGAQASAQAALHAGADNQISLAVTMRDGVKVSLTLSYQANGLGVQISSSGKLSAADSKAMQQIAQAFQSAIDGATAEPPSIDVGGLTQLNTTAIASVNLKAHVLEGDGSAFTLSFSADDKQRNISANGSEGTVNLNVNLADAAMRGSQAQQSKAVQAYLKQFDQAGNVGQANGDLMSMFKDAFSELNSPYPSTAGANQGVTNGYAPLEDQDQAMLTGLADFQGSIKQATTSPNPLKLSEVDGFNYQISQQTSIKGRNDTDRSISQQTQSNLSASFHEALQPHTPLMLTTDPHSQNYQYVQLNAQTSSDSEIRYGDNLMTAANFSLASNESTAISKYQLGNLVSQTTTPASESMERDLLSTLAPLHISHPTTTEEQLARQSTLDGVNDLVLTAPTLVAAK